MKANNELRLGNLVIDKEGFVLQITSIDEAFVTTITFDDDSDTENFYESVNAIQLTEDWLIRLGFVGRKDFMWKGIVGIQIKDGAFYLAIKDLSNVLFHSVVQVKGVHHLQNLYFDLTGQELTIK